jgi:uncharacterized UBP type Zn finger protein
MIQKVSVDQEALSTLLSMGFPQSLAETALETSVNDLEKALNWIEAEADKSSAK